MFIENLCTKYQFLVSCILGGLKTLAKDFCTDITKLLNSYLDPVWL